MNDRHALIAYLSTLGALVIVFIAGLGASALGVTNIEAFGFGAITGGLIGVLRAPSQPRPTDADPMPTKVVNQASDAVPVEPQG